jgi:hypothetical protein
MALKGDGNRTMPPGQARGNVPPAFLRCSVVGGISAF